MPRASKWIIAAALTYGAQGMVAAQASADSLPLKTTRTIAFETDEGTWMPLDLSPDGRTIVFALMGDLYLLPIAGGKATRFTNGQAWDTQPTFSPDGRQIAFISDRNGSDNIWVMNVDGSEARRISSETDDIVTAPEWLPDSRSIAARVKTPYSTQTQHWLRLFAVDGSPSKQLFPKTGSGFTSGPSASRDGRTLYFSTYANSKIKVHALNVQTGDIEVMSLGTDEAVSPRISPDGRWLAYYSRRDGIDGMRIREVATGQDEWLVAAVNERAQWAWSDHFPRYAFTPDSRAVIFNSGGKINRVDIVTKNISLIPFSASVELPAAKRLQVTHRVDDGPVRLEHLRWTNLSRDGKRITFSAIGKVWVSDVGGAPRRLTKATEREFAPAISPDGQRVAYISLSDREGGQILVRPFAGGDAVALTPKGGAYAALTWSITGDKIVYVGTANPKPGCGTATRKWTCPKPAMAWVSSNGGERHKILDSVWAGTLPMVRGTTGSERVYYFDQKAPWGEPAWLTSVTLDGSSHRVHAKLPPTDAIYPLDWTAAVSPDERWLLFARQDNAYLAKLSSGADTATITLDPRQPQFRKLTVEGMNSLAWGDDGKTIVWTITNKLRSLPLEDALRTVSRGEWPIRTTSIDVTVPRNRSAGVLFVRGARIITMKGDQVIPSGDILVKNGRIAAIGPSGTVTPPAGAHVIDARGKTIIPGLIDIHAHPQSGSLFVPEAAPDLAGALAYGITTIRDPSGSLEQFMWAELVEAGELIGPRMFGVGVAMEHLRHPIKSYEDARNAVAQFKLQGATSIKQYMQPRRLQRQWVRMAAEELGLNITNEGGYDIKLAMAMALDGMTAVEHDLRLFPLYRDVYQVMGRTGMTYNPTLVVLTNGHHGVDRYWQQRWNPEADAKLMRFVEHEYLDQQHRPASWTPVDSAGIVDIAGTLKRIIQAGGRVGMGAHGVEHSGLGCHWEMWTMAWGGLTPLEVIRTATMGSAESFGAERDVGSLEVGKIADLLILDRNPLENIQNTNSIRFVVKDGIVYDGNTLDEVWPRRRTFPRFSWSLEEEKYEALKRRQRR